MKRQPRSSSDRPSSEASPNDVLLEQVLGRLTPLPVTTRNLFGGRGLYLEGRFFGVIFDGRLYFRTDAESRGAFVSRGMPALQPKYRPAGPKNVDRHFEVPSEIARRGVRLRAWALRAARCARD
jgi:DNA transformation protein